jgi:4-hydroxythreonine-4-phosphate dehydrogenase
MGDATGIGPETVIGAFASGHAAGLVAIGSARVFARAAAAWAAARPGRLPPPVAVIERIEEQTLVPTGALPVIEPEGLPPDLEALPWGRIDARAGAAAARCIEAAASLALRGEAAGVVTAPVHKEALAAAGGAHPGHTELLQSLAARGGVVPPVRMMLANPELRVVLVTIHLALRDALHAITFASVLETIRIAHAAGSRLGVPGPRIAVAGVNPHAGEGGLFGREEIEHIAPAISAACAEGIDARGPFAPDTVFMRARHAPPGKAGEFDIVVAMTHDHGLIPVKYLGVEQGVNVTLGLPFVRTSPDHGTAFDIAGRGVADPASLVAAIRMARRLAGDIPTAGG